MCLTRSKLARLTPPTAVRVSLSVFNLVPDLLFDCSRVLEYAKIRTVLQSTLDRVQSWDARIEFVDDMTVLEVVPRNSPSLLNVVVDDIHAFAVNNNMRLYPRKRKTMTVEFLHYNSCVTRALAVGGSDIEQVSTFKLLGVHLSEDLTWAVHCDFIGKKTNRRLYALRQLKKCKVPSADIVHVYCARIRSIILEYVSAVFADLRKYLACYLENVQKRALSIIWPGISYV